jgi:hypothetical protein
LPWQVRAQPWIRCPFCDEIRDNMLIQAVVLKGGGASRDNAQLSSGLDAGGRSSLLPTATGNEIARIVAYRCIIEASIGKRIVLLLLRRRMPSISGVL